MFLHYKAYVSVENISVNICMVEGFQYGILLSLPISSEASVSLHGYAGVTNKNT